MNFTDMRTLRFRQLPVRLCGGQSLTPDTQRLAEYNRNLTGGTETRMDKTYTRGGKVLPETCRSYDNGSFGQLVVLGFGVAAFTPAPYQRHRL